ncbi:MAG: hypothetical protein AAGA03_09395 [Planctomycetota bacterium]
MPSVFLFRGRCRPLGRVPMGLLAGVTWAATAILTNGCDSGRTTTDLRTAAEAKVQDSDAETIEDSAPLPPDDGRPLAELEADAEVGLSLKRSGDTVVQADLRNVSAQSVMSVIRAVSETDSVGEVLLKGEFFSDDVVKPLTGLPKLKRFRAEKTSLGDATLARLAEADQLELLYYTEASKLTPMGVAQIGGLSKLRNLRVGGDAVNDQSVAVIGSLSNLGALGLLSTGITDAGLDKIAGLPRLKELMLFGTPVTDACLTSVAKFPALVTLKLRQTKITGHAFAPLSTTNIVDLELAETDFGNQGMDAITKMPKLRKVNFWLTKIDDDGVAKLKGMTQLTSLNLDNLPPVSDASVSVINSLPQLDFLHLGKTSITPEGVKSIRGLDKLKTLHVTNLGVTDEDAQAIQNNLPALQTLVN